jgi:hypothetical protein
VADGDGSYVWDDSTIGPNTPHGGVIEFKVPLLIAHSIPMKVSVIARARLTAMTAGGGATIEPGVSLNGIVYPLTPPAPVTMTYVDYRVEYPNSPATGKPWTVAEFNQAVISAYSKRMVQGNHLAITQMYTEVCLQP